MSKIKISAESYAEFKECVAVLFPLVMPQINLPIEKHPLSVLSAMEVSSPANARAGLAMALNDLIQGSFLISSDQIKEIDTLLASKGLFTLTKLRYLYSDKIQKIVRRGIISNDVEYYLLKNIVDSGVCENSPRETLEKMLDNYEFKG
ncbi:hypothetical protein [Massilia violaceinigra]|uniref:hypothetical protein n=1 Tax=Massilia violaceinigra TaxID=2045208 RepID=UPI0012FDF256|nr:hypothetical protein [Massilia violaceinigra]